ncbi:hypothetical protein AYL99_07047 [Fonsecaea erecta]|uniref:Uncharacterized protein n=1 Tax=Fonsecaea erecta TaxID=1367422 RepID=A0A178ZDV4_9EURO|nr:hypothetical protein AYL99_07047 [Fonsecaea erecta]OAP57957.1 hypothetical protein AYL99_07047 [Fonsecaea erecta]
MSRLGGRDLIPLHPSGLVYGGGGGVIYGDDDDVYPPPTPHPPGVLIRQPTVVRRTSRDIPLPDSWPYPPTPYSLQTRFPEPPRGSVPHKQTMKFTPWILNLTSETHKCADLNLFRLPRPVARGSLLGGSGGSSARNDRGAIRLGHRQQGHQDPEGRRRGTVVLPIQPGPKRRIEFDISVMTLSDVLYTPGAQYSELSWKVLARQGFTRHVLHHDHMHDVTEQYVARHSPPTSVEIGWQGIRRVEPLPLPLLTAAAPPGFPFPFPSPSSNFHPPRPPLTPTHRPPPRSRYPDPRGPGPGPINRCGRLDKESSVIRHRGVPDVDILWVGYDKFIDPCHLHVHMTAAAMVDVRLWSWGVEMGVVGKSAGFRGWVDWIEGSDPDGNGRGTSADNREANDEEDLFRKIVQGGLRAGEELGII